MFKPELWQSHDEYRTLVTTVGRRLSRNNPKYYFDLYKEKRDKLLNLDLDPLLDFIPAYYSDGGRPAEHQAQLLRSLVLFVLLFNKTKAGTSLTSWVREVLPSSISLTVLTGCSSTDELPPLGSYYDLMDRFWLGDRHVYSRSSLLPAGRNGKNLKKLSAVTESSLNRRIQLQQPQGISWGTSWMGNPFPITHRRHCRKSFLSLPSSLPCRLDSLMLQTSPFPVTARP